ncbi:MAG: hypothetical protein J1F07_03015 [Muribaculaceae bacterium]|nr:hypothetical protein [Muribaculaceae bacterium]
MTSLITNNPYRILGVFVNTPLKERTSNINRFKAFFKIGKSVESEADFSIPLEQSPIRTPLTIDEANNALNLPIERLKNAFFWFACSNPAEAIAFRHLSSGDIQKATSIFEKFSCWSSLLNYHTISLLQGKMDAAILTFSKLIEFRKEHLFEALNLETLKLNNSEIYLLYYEELSKVYSPSEILKAAKGILIEEHLLQRIIFRSVRTYYIDKLNKLIEVASSAIKNDASSNLQAGQVLKEQASPILNDLKDNCNEKETEYAIIADKLALQILQNGIQYYNHTSDSEAPRIVMPLFEYSKSIAVGHLAKRRCENNYKTIKKAYNELPPIEILEDIKAIETLLNKFDEGTESALKSKELVINCAPYLGNIKEKCGLKHVAAITISTKIVRKALNSIIGDVNNAIDSLNRSHHAYKYSERARVKKVLSDAWDATLCLDKLPLHEDSKSWYLGNCNKLKEFMRQAGISTLRFSCFTIQTEVEYFQSCKNKIDYIRYLTLYPNARYKQIAQKQIEEFERKEKIEWERRVKEEAKRKEARKKLIDEINASIRLDQLWKLQQKCTDKDSQSLLDNRAWSLCKNRADYKEYLYHLPKGKHKIEAEKKSKTIGNKLLFFLKIHKGWVIFFSIIISILALIGIIWGPEGYQYMLYTIGVIGAIAAWGGLSSIFKDGSDAGTYFAILIIGAIIAVACFVGASSMDDYVKANKEIRAQENLIKKEKEAYSWFINNPSEENFKEYLKGYPRGTHIEEVTELYINSIRAKGPIALNNLKNEYPSIANDFRVSELITQMCDSLYAIAEATNSFTGWEEYQEAVPSDEYRDSDVRKDKADSRWNTESSAWRTAQELNTTAAYSRYIELYPKGKHYAQADKILIDSEVADVFSSEHGTLPAMDKTSYGYGSTTTISVFNNTSFTLTLLYSGPESKRLILSPYERGSVKLKNGSYKVAASASSSNIQNYAGTEYFEGGSCEVEFHIVTSKTTKDLH